MPFDKARPKVEAAWKELEARKLAQKEVWVKFRNFKAGRPDKVPVA